ARGYPTSSAFRANQPTCLLKARRGDRRLLCTVAETRAAMGGPKSTQAMRANSSPFPQRHSVIKFGCFPWVIVLGLLVGIAGVWSSNKEVLGLFHDDGIYAVVAKSLSNGAGYRIISLPFAPDQTKYPFLYSDILSWL